MKNDQVTVSQLSRYVSQEVTLKGWLYNRRSSGKVQFVLLRDGTGIVQCILLKGEINDELYRACDTLPQESSLIIRGVVREDKRAPGGYEIFVQGVSIVQSAEFYPITPQAHGTDFLMRYRHLWLRSRKQVAVLKIRSEIIKAIRDFFDEQGFVLVDAPIFTPSACEGTTTLFEVNYFDREKAFLTQSGQLYMEAAAMALGRVYCFGPTFRAERSKTRRHLTEFWMVEPEVAYADLDDVMTLGEELVAFIVQRALERRKEELAELERDTSLLEKVVPPFPRISYTEAVSFLREKGIEFQWGGDLGAEDETVLSNSFDKPVSIHRYPAAVKAFYMKPDPEDEKLALCVDMLAPEGFGEIIGGGQRSDDLAHLEMKIKEHGLPREAFEWYLDLRRYGTVPHGGFGLGVERTVAWICGLKHVRESIPFPRMLYKIYP